MAERKGGFAMKGELTNRNGRFYMTKIVNPGKDTEREETYDLTAELEELLGHTFSLTATENVSIDPVE